MQKGKVPPQSQAAIDLCDMAAFQALTSAYGTNFHFLQEMKILFSTSSSHLRSVKINETCRFQGKGIRDALCIGCYVITGTILIW